MATISRDFGLERPVAVELSCVHLGTWELATLEGRGMLETEHLDNWVLRERPTNLNGLLRYSSITLIILNNTLATWKAILILIECLPVDLEIALK